VTAYPSLSVVAQNITASFNSVKEFSESHELVLNSANTQLIVLKPTGKKYQTISIYLVFWVIVLFNPKRE